MIDNSDTIIEDIKWVLFGDGNYDVSFKFETWIGDGHSFIVKDDDEQEYRVTVTREKL